MRSLAAVEPRSKQLAARQGQSPPYADASNDRPDQGRGAIAPNARGRLLTLCSLWWWWSSSFRSAIDCSRALDKNLVTNTKTGNWTENKKTRNNRTGMRVPGARDRPGRGANLAGAANLTRDPRVQLARDHGVSWI